ncbi:MAG: hypothetical protein LBF37_02420 [Rickettsiales bacterium]|nr:hypothetical protein [Rickettsiales bacterium]
MDYPGNFEIPVFPAGKRIAISRFMAIATLVSFLIIIFLCGILIWSARSDRLNPFMISANLVTGEWQVVGRSDTTTDYSVEYTMQESVAGNFVKDWFKISSTPVANEVAWKQCDRATCGSGDGLMFGTRQCAIYCSVSDEVFSRFFYNTLPTYQARAENGEVWYVNDNDITISPAGQVGPVGGTWEVRAIVSSETTEDFAIIAFIKIARNNNFYPKTMGYYIADFNSYRM